MNTNTEIFAVFREVAVLPAEEIPATGDPGDTQEEPVEISTGACPASTHQLQLAVVAAADPASAAAAACVPVAQCHHYGLCQ